MSQEYKIIQENDKKEFENQMASHLNIGWKPLGNLIVIKAGIAMEGKQYTYIQVMTR